MCRRVVRGHAVRKAEKAEAEGGESAFSGLCRWLQCVVPSDQPPSLADLVKADEGESAGEAASEVQSQQPSPLESSSRRSGQSRSIKQRPSARKSSHRRCSVLDERCEREYRVAAHQAAAISRRHWSRRRKSRKLRRIARLVCDAPARLPRVIHADFCGAKAAVSQSVGAVDAAGDDAGMARPRGAKVDDQGTDLVVPIHLMAAASG